MGALARSSRQRQARALGAQALRVATLYGRALRLGAGVPMMTTVLDGSVWFMTCHYVNNTNHLMFAATWREGWMPVMERPRVPLTAG